MNGAPAGLPVGVPPPSPRYAHSDSALAAAFVDGQCRAIYNFNSGRSHQASDVVFPGLYFHCELETRVGVHYHVIALSIMLIKSYVR